MNIIITPRSSKTNFYNNCNSIEMLFDDNDHHTFINSKYDINELNALNNKVNYFGILHLNIASLSKHIDSLSNFLSMNKFCFPIIGLCEHKIRSNSFIIASPYQVILFVMMKLRAPMAVLVCT